LAAVAVLEAAKKLKHRGYRVSRKFYSVFPCDLCVKIFPTESESR
jgi:hypothetical protein